MTTVTENNFLIILKCIAVFLPVKDLLTCRLVSTTWQIILDKYCHELWCFHCHKDYPNVSYSAFTKSQLSWYCLYKSLRLWDKLPYAQLAMFGFAFANNFNEMILGIQVLRGGIIGVHSRDKIEYFDIHTLQVANRNPIVGNYCKYMENDYIIVCLNYSKQLTVIFKSNWQLIQEYLFVDTSVENIDLFTIIEENIYGVAEENNIYEFQFVNEVLVCTDAYCVSEGVMSLGHQNGSLYVLTLSLKILKVEDEVLKSIPMEKEIASLFELRKYNFLQHLDFKMYYHWKAFRTKFTPKLSVSEIVTVRSYERFIFCGYEWGLLKVFKSPYHNDIVEIISTTPIKLFGLNFHTSSQCAIIDLDIIEAEDGHNIIVATPQNLVVINLMHK